MARTPEQRLDALRQQQAQLQNRIQKEQAKISGQRRKEDTRRKIVAGAVVLEHAFRDATFGRAFRDLIDRHVTRPQDRALFDFSTLEKRD